MTFQQGDIVHISLDDELPEPDHNLPERGWDAIVVGVDDDAQLEVAWLSRFTTPKNPRLSPMQETWDNQTALVQPDYDARVKLLKRATYAEATVG